MGSHNGTSANVDNMVAALGVRPRTREGLDTACASMAAATPNGYTAHMTTGPATMQLSAVLIPAEEGGFTAINPETGTATQGESVEEALANLREATELYLEEFPLKLHGKPLLTTFEVALRAA